MTPKKVHFIGINGCAISGVAIVAKKFGFEVSGCDRASDTVYASQLVDAGIAALPNHDDAHVANADIVAVSAALLQQSEKVSEVATAQKAGKLMQWQEFIGEYILPKFRLVAVCGTHGKTTTSSMMAHVMERAGLDPTAFIGAIVPNWQSSCRVGGGDWAVIEADEYANNFAPYRPEFVILNNLEMEHPEYFADFEHYKKTFRDFLANANPNGTLVYNADDENIGAVLDAFRGNKIPFSARDVKVMATADGQDFDGFHIKLLGRHNVANAMAVITMARTIGISDDDIRGALADFKGAGHRLEKIHDDGKVVIYDDYAHHHTQVVANIQAVSDSNAKLIVVYEPHQISRYTQNTGATLAGLATADVAIIVGFWRGREDNIALPDVNADIARAGLKNVSYIENHDEATRVVEDLIKNATGPTIVLVMGAGVSWKIAKTLKNSV